MEKKVKKKKVNGFSKNPDLKKTGGIDPSAHIVQANVKEIGETKISLSDVVPENVLLDVITHVGDDVGAIISRSSQYTSLGHRVAEISSGVMSTAMAEDILKNSTNEFISEGESLMSSIEVLLKAGIIGEESELAKLLGKASSEFSGLINDIKDPKNTDSLVYAINKDMKKIFEDQNAAIDNMMSGVKKGSLAYETLSETKRSLSAMEKLVAKQNIAATKSEKMLEQILVGLGLKAEVDEAKEKSSGKGATFEDLVTENLHLVTSHYQDVPKHIGTKTHGGTSKKGDHMIQVFEGESHYGNIAIECKAGKFSLDGPTSIVSQTLEAMENTKSSFGVGIVDSSQAGKKVRDKGFLNPHPHVFLLCVDKSSEDFTLLEMLYPILRVMVIEDHKKSLTQTKIDDDSIMDGLKEMVTKLQDLNKVKKNLTSSASITKTAVEELQVVQNSLMKDVKDILHLVMGGTSE